jgi:hypothetical protein
MKILDCYFDSDPDGFPTSSYECKDGEAENNRASLGEYFDRVAIVEHSNGQSVQRLPQGDR